MNKVAQPQGGFRIGIDLGGTKIETVLMDGEGAVAFRERVPTPRSYPGTVAAIAALVARIDAVSGGTPPVGVGTPGAWVASTRSMKNCNSTWLNGKPLLDDLNAATDATATQSPRDSAVRNRPEGQVGVADATAAQSPRDSAVRNRPESWPAGAANDVATVQSSPREGRVRMANDANCFALSEALDGAGRGARVVFGVILGTGVGGGIVADGRLLPGANAIAGEWGHAPLPYFRADPATSAVEQRLADRPCYCGRVNCIETFLSGPGLAATHQALTGERLPAAAIPASAASVDLYVAMLARSLAQIVNILDPDVIVLGGGVSNISRLSADVLQQLPRYAFTHEGRTAVAVAEHGDASGVLGACRLWPP